MADNPDGGVSGEPAGNDETDTGTSEEDSGSGGSEVGVLDGGNDSESDKGSGESGTDGTPGRRGRRERKANDGSSTGKGSGRNRVPGQSKDEGTGAVGLHSDGSVDSEAGKEAKAKAQEDAAYRAEKERIKDETQFSREI